MGSYASGAPGPDGLSFLFYQRFWEVIKKDFMALVRDFECGALDIQRLNYSIVTLIPKEPDARHMKKFRPICLSNCSVKIFSKAMTNRVSPCQTAFVRGRFILESIVTAHEAIHEVHKSAKSGVVLKLDYEKAYDRVNWDFLVEMLTSRGFGSKWISWILSILQQSSFCVKINDAIAPYFVGGKGLKQGDLISPLLFNLVADVFSRMLAKAARGKFISGIIPHIIPHSLISLQYADDTILFLDPDPNYAKNLKWLLACFERLYGMKINYDKYELVLVNLDDAVAKVLSQIFCCKVGGFPLKYLGVPLHYLKLKREDPNPSLTR